MIIIYECSKCGEQYSDSYYATLCERKCTLKELQINDEVILLDDTFGETIGGLDDVWYVYFRTSYAINTLMDMAAESGISLLDEIDEIKVDIWYAYDDEIEEWTNLTEQYNKANALMQKLLQHDNKK